ncbi:MAG: glycosyltransferase 87 family protein [Planctomycetota bacterium]
MWTRRRRAFLFLALGCAAAAAAISFLNASLGFWSKRDGDLPVYLRAAERMAAGEEIYRPEDPRPFTYPPFLSLTAYPGTLLPEPARRPAWYCLNALALVAVVLLVHRNVKETLRAPSAPTPWRFWAALALLGMRHVSSVFENQSNDLLVLLSVALCADCAVRGRGALAGAMAGLGAALKATPLLFLPVFAWQRKWAACAGLAAAFLAASFLPDAVFRRDDGGSWALAWQCTFLGEVRPGAPASRVGGAWWRGNVLNQSLSGTIYRLSTPPAVDPEIKIDASLWRPGRRLLQAVTVAAQLAVLGAVFFATRAQRGGLESWGGAGAVACGMVLLSPMSSKSHFAILVLPLSFCLAEWIRRRGDAVLLAHLLAILLAGTLTPKGLWGREIGNRILVHGSVTFCALAALSASVYLLARRRRPA